MIIWGFRSVEHFIAILTFVCQQCGNRGAQRFSKHVRKFTLFFIPLFPVSTRYLVTCATCGVASELPKETGQLLEQQIQNPQHHPQDPSHPQPPGQEPQRPPQQWEQPQQGAQQQRWQQPGQ